MTGRLLELLTSVCSLVFLASRAFVGLYFRSCLRRHSSFLLWKPEHLNRGLCRVAWVVLQIERLCLPKFCKWSPNLQCDGTWTWGFGWLGYEGGACMKGINALIKSYPWRAPVAELCSTMWGHREKMTISKPEQTCQTLSLLVPLYGHLSPQNYQKYVFFKSPSLW